MTFNEFKMCSVLFCKTFEGKKYGDVVKTCHVVDRRLIIPKHPKFNQCDFLLCGSFVWHFFDLGLHIITDDWKIIIRLLTVEDFLNHFKIHLEDIV